MPTASKAAWVLDLTGQETHVAVFQCTDQFGVQSQVSSGHIREIRRYHIHGDSLCFHGDANVKSNP